MKVIGVVGGIGSGKSTVVMLISQAFNSYIINADHIGHNILKRGQPGYHPILECFGDSILDKDSEINRKRLGEIVFSDPEKLQLLNNISHPLIYQEVKHKIESISKMKMYDYIIVDAALLIEIQLIDLVDEVWGIYVPLKTQIKRIMLRDGFSKDEAIRRINSQLPWDKIKQFVDIKIDNSKGVKYTQEQIISLLSKD